MREIKFRAWDDDGGRMLTHEHENLAGDLLEAAMSGGMPIMQYTGLKDSKGREIYEGDIVRAFDRWNARVVFDSRFIAGDDALAGYDVLGWWLDVKAEQSLSEVHLLCEVIGNIYENPKLLEVKS